MTAQGLRVRIQIEHHGRMALLDGLLRPVHRLIDVCADEMARAARD